MAEADNQGWLRKFIGGRQSDEPTRSPSAVRAETNAASMAADQFAREAVVALHRFEQTFEGEPDRRRRVAERFGQLWDRAGLNRVDWDAQRAQLSDAERTLVAAAGMADGPGGWVTVADAGKRASSPGRAVQSAAVVDNQLQKAYGNQWTPPDAPVWLEQSLGRLAKAQVVKELVGLDTKTKVDPRLRQAADRVVQQTQQLDDAGRKVTSASSKAEKAENRYFSTLGIAFAYCTAAMLSHTPNAPNWYIAAKYSPGAALVAATAFTGRLSQAADRQLAGARHDAAGQRANLGQALDKMPGSASRRGGGAPGR